MSVIQNPTVKRNQRWREQFNPLRGLTMSRAISLLEAYPRGEMADLQWAYSFIEQTDPDLFALVERRTSALLELDWNIKTIGNGDGALRVPGRTEAAVSPKIAAGSESNADLGTLAVEQAAALREAYDRVDNLYTAIEHLAMATFRGFAHLEKHHGQDGELRHLEICDQWNLVRDGLRGPWKYNPEARSVPYRLLGDEWRIDPAGWVIREVSRHVNRIGLIKQVRQTMSQHDWDAFIDIYGLPGAIIIGPPHMSAEEKAEYLDTVAAVANGADAYLPNGSEVRFSTVPRTANPFREHLRFLTEQLVLAGTGGLLTMLTASGSGTLAGHAHQDAFQQIARSEARRISEVLQKQLDAEVLAREFPGQPCLAYFELAANEETSVGEIIDHALKLHQAGFGMNGTQLSEKTGYQIEGARDAE